MTYLKTVRSGLAACWLVAAAAAWPQAALLPAELFYRAPDMGAAVLSPSGRWLAVTYSQGAKRTGLAVVDLGPTGGATLVAGFNDADVGNFQWVNDDRLVFDTHDSQSGGSDQTPGRGLFGTRRDGSDRVQLVRQHADAFVSSGGPAPKSLDYSHRLLHVPGSGDEVIVGEMVFNNHGEYDTLIAKRLNVVTQRTTTLSYGAPPHIVRLLFDAQAEPRLALTRYRGRGTVQWRAAGSRDWQVLAEFDSLQAPFEPRFIDAAGNLYVTVSHGKEGTTQLHKFDFAAGRPTKDPLVVTPGFDFDGGLISERVGGVALGVRVLTDAETTVWFDPGMAAVQKLVDERLPGRVTRLSCRRCEQPDRVVLVKAWSDRDPGQYWIYQDNADPKQAQWQRVGLARKDVDPRQMGSTAFHRIRARDGLDLPLWLTTPAAPATGPRPAVVLVHGGPWVRGRSWDWDADTQFLASRGYLVIEPEFRGSLGYGVAHYRAGWRQWGRAMQDDLADALDWAVKQGLADAKRTCIAGASYGGYATLMGLVNDPERYRCGVAWLAVTDPRLMFKWSGASDSHTEGREFLLPQLIGDPVADAEMLTAVAPLAQAARIKAPLLLAFGADDRRVPLVHGTRMRDALREAGQKPEWVVYPDEGHGWFKLANRVDFAQRFERFLAEHLR